MDTTINTMQALQQQSTTANMEAKNNKRTASDALAAGYNFHTGGAQMPMQAMQMGSVNCSKEEAKHQHRDTTMNNCLECSNALMLSSNSSG